MDRARHSRSAGRSRREERRSGSVRASMESAAGNLSPGRTYERHQSSHRNRHERSEGGFFANLFGRKKSPAPQPNPPPPQHYPEQQAPPSSSSAHPYSAQQSPGSKLKSMFNFGNGRSSPGQGGSLSPPLDPMQAKDMAHKLQLLQAQLQDYERMKQQLATEQRSAQDWKEKWNYQNFKLNLMVDMLVLRVLELDSA